MNTEAAVFLAEGLTKHFGKIHAIDSLTLQVKETNGTGTRISGSLHHNTIRYSNHSCKSGVRRHKEFSLHYEYSFSSNHPHVRHHTWLYHRIQVRHLFGECHSWYACRHYTHPGYWPIDSFRGSI